MIDVHCHILPGVDDGVRTTEEAIDLVRMEVSGGTRAFIATPHVIERRDYDRLGERASRLEELRVAVSTAGIDADLFLGGEIYPTAHVLRALDAGQPLTLAGKGRHMLVDLPLGALPNDFDALLFEIQARGVTPILAHPERAAPFQRDPEGLREHLDRGVALQVNAGSLTGRYGPAAARVARVVLRRRWAHFLASDAHRPGRRPGLGTAVASLRTELDDDYLNLLAVGSAACVLAGDPLPSLPAAPPRRAGGMLARLFSRGRRRDPRA